MAKIKRAASLLLVGVVFLMGSASTQAALIDRGNGLIYDTVLHVTWAQDVDLSHALGGPGIFNWYGAKAWVDQLAYGGYDDWRLPTLGPVNGVQFRAVFSCDGSSDYSYGISAPGLASAGFTGNELAYMYYVNLGNKQRRTGEDCNTYGPDVGPQNASFVDGLTGQTVSFLNLQDIKQSFWTDLAPRNGGAFYFTYYGFNDWTNAFYQRGRAWAVRDGDVFVAAVPEPSTLLLLLSGLLPALLFGKKRTGSRQRLVD